MKKPTRSPAGRPKGSLAVAMIVRNEARCIARCLDSVRPWVDKMVVLDTGSTDNTIELARQAGADVYEMEWPGSFAEARNRSLELADADWNLVIDADEWIESGGELLRSWCQTPHRLGVVCQRSAFELAGVKGAQPEGQHWITRILPRNVRFEGRVHEQAASTLPRVRVDLYLGHDGYLDAQLDTKRDRNGSLLLLDLEDSPGDPYILYQLGKETEVRREFAAASEYFRQSLAATPADANWLHCLSTRYLYCLGQVGDFDTAFAFADQFMMRWEKSPDFFFVLGNLALDKGMTDPANALDEWIPLAVSAWERCLEIGDQPLLEGSVHGRGSHLARTNLDAIRSQLPGLAA